MKLKKTPFYQKHLQNNGRIIDFSGWALPIEYKSMLAEAEAVRKICGIFDASHMGEIEIKGERAFSFLQGVVSNDISVIGAGQMQYNLFLNEAGGIIDDLMVYHQGKTFLCVVNACNKDTVFNWLNKNIQSGIEIIDRSKELALISIQGPYSARVIKRFFGPELAALRYLSFRKEKIKGREVLISRSGYTGEDGFEIYLPWKDSIEWWDKLTELGQEFGLEFCGLGSRDILRIEAGFPLYGHELNDTITPYEASLGWAVKLNKNFIGREKLLKIKNEGVKRKRIGFIIEERAVPRQGYLLYSKGRAIGEVSSGTYSPNISKFIGMAYVEKDYIKCGLEVSMEVRNKLYKAKLAKFPFVDIKTKKHIEY